MEENPDFFAHSHRRFSRILSPRQTREKSPLRDFPTSKSFFPKTFHAIIHAIDFFSYSLTKGVFMSQKTLEQIDEQIESAKLKLNANIRELVEIIVNDIPTFAQKHVRRAFIENVDRVENKTDAEIAEIKEKLGVFSHNLVEKYRAELLADENRWIGKDVPLDAGKTLDGNPFIAPILARIADDIRAFIESIDLLPLEMIYKTPAYFINGKYAPGMIEKYWAQLADLRSLEEEYAQIEHETRKNKLAQRWDEN